MNKLLLLLLLLAAGPTLAQASSKAADPSARLLKGTKATRRRTNDKSTFHKEHRNTTLDLHIHDHTQFHTAQANRNFTYGQPGKNRKSKFGKKPIIKLGGKGNSGRIGHRTTG